MAGSEEVARGGGWASFVRGLGRDKEEPGYEEWVQEVWSARVSVPVPAKSVCVLGWDESLE
eukprot:3203626-Rhodomonas_salina.2